MLTTTIEQSHSQRIETELEAAGLSRLSLHRFSSTYLPKIIHHDEHIKGAVFGRRKESEGFFGFVEGLLLATDKRVLFVDHRPGYTTMDELGYDVVSGVNVTTTLFYASVTLFTKIANYQLSFTSRKQAEQFADYVEQRISGSSDNRDEQTAPELPGYEVIIDGRAKTFLNEHDIGVLSTVERTGAVSGAVVYYTVRDGHIYFVTKASSRKADDILGNQHVSFTIFDESHLTTLQLQGLVMPVESAAIRNDIAAVIGRPRQYADNSHTPPVGRMSGDTICFRIIPTRFSYVDFSHK